MFPLLFVMSMIQLPRRILFYLALCFAMALIAPKSHAAGLTLTQDKGNTGFISLQLPYFEDQTGANSLSQAMAQFQSLQKTGALPPVEIMQLNGGAVYWVNLTFTNNTRYDKWSFEFPDDDTNTLSSIKALTMYDPARLDQPIVQWAASEENGWNAALPMMIKPGETQDRYVMIQTWPGTQAKIAPALKTQQFVLQEKIDSSEKLSIAWLIMGAIFGAGLLQLILTRQPVQGMVALNAFLVGIGIFLLQHPDILLGLIGGHPLILPILLSSLYNIGAGFLLMVAGRGIHPNTLPGIIPVILNILLVAVALFNIDWLLALPVAGDLPAYMMLATGLLLTVSTIFLGLKRLSLLYFVPAWLTLGAMPWGVLAYPLAMPTLYVVLLGIAGIASVFALWRAVDRETKSLQRRLRQELKAIKDKYREDNENWTLKMDNQRAILNDLREREQQRSAELDAARQEADAANRAKSDFLAIISHEIRTPMNGIMGIVQIINETKLDEKQREYIDVIKNSGDTMLTLLNDILDYSKIEKGAIDLENIPFSLPKLVQSVATLMSGRALDKGLAVLVDIAPNLAENFSGDPNRIRQILLNLISNAVKFTEKGSVTLRIKSSPGGRVLFEVADTGMGISEEAQGKLFQAYVQADASISRRFGGTGLGLNICRMLVNAMQGAIGVKSTEGQGSVFWFDIPLDIAAAPQAVEIRKNDAEQPLAGNKKLSVLVIDDNSVNLKIVAGLLEMEGHTPMTAESGEIALRLVNQHEFALILVDMLMPNMSGREFVEKLHLLPDKHKAQLPVFALTGLADEKSKQDILTAGMLGVITKPVSKDALRDAVRQVLVAQEKEIELTDIIAGIDYLSEADKQKLLHALTEKDKAEKPEVPMLNMSMLSELKESLPVATLTEIFDELIQKAKELTDEIEKADAEHDFAALGEKAHNIRGMAGNFGLQSLMDHSAAIENAVRAGENEKAAALAKSSRKFLDQSLSELDAWLKS